MALTSEFPFASWQQEIESLEAGFAICLACQEEEDHLLGMVINLILLPFQRHVDMLASEREKTGCANNLPPVKGKQLQ
jgi:hypothetical protein